MGVVEGMCLPLPALPVVTVAPPDLNQGEG